MSADPVAYRLTWSDWAGRRVNMGDPEPKANIEDYATIELARAAQQRLYGAEIVSCVTPLYMRAAQKRRKALMDAFGGLPIMRRPAR